MTSALRMPATEDERARRRSAERGVVRMLHRVRSCGELPDAFGRALCRATGLGDPLEAFARIVEEAIPPSRPGSARLRSAILDVDFRGGTKNFEFARALSMSRRHFQRIRSAAVAAIAGRLLDDVDPDSFCKAEPVASSPAEVYRIANSASSARSQLRRLRQAVELGAELGEDAFRSSPAVPIGLVSVLVAYSRELNGAVGAPAPQAGDHRRYDFATRFWIEHVSYLRARDRGLAAEMHAVTASLLRLAEDAVQFVAAHCSRADASIRLGDLDAAEEHLRRADQLAGANDDPNLRQAIVCATSRMALARGDLERAEEIARGMRAIVNPRHRDATQCLIDTATARLLRGAFWCPPPDAELGVCLCDRLTIEAEHARHLVRDGAWMQAESTASRAYAAADRSYEGVAARCAAVLRECSLEAGDLDETNRWTRRAVAHLLRARDQSLCASLFAGCARTIELDDSLTAPLYERLCLIVPQMFADTGAQRTKIEAGLAAVLRAIVRGGSAYDACEAFGHLKSCGSALSHYAKRAAPQIEEAVALVASAAMRRPAWNVHSRTRRVVQELVDELDAAKRGALFVAVPTGGSCAARPS